MFDHPHRHKLVGAKFNRFGVAHFFGGIGREQVRLALDAENIESRPLWKPMHMQPVYEGAKFFGSGVCEQLFEQGLCLPSGSNLTEEEYFNTMEDLSEQFYQTGSPNPNEIETEIIGEN